MKNRKLVTFLLLAFNTISLASCGDNQSSDPHFTVTWKNWDGSILEIDNNVAKGSTPHYDGSAPEKEGDANYKYVWSGWTPQVTAVISDIEYIATFQSEVNTYTITWKNWDGSILEIDSNVSYGTMPEYNGTKPEKDNDLQYSYAFCGWDKPISTVISDAVYTASYNSHLEKAHIVFNLNGGQTQHSSDSIYVSEISNNYFFFDLTKPGFNFRGWSYNGNKVFDQNGVQLFVPELKEEMTFNAEFGNDAYLKIVTNINNAGTIVGEGYYPYNSNVDVSVNVNEGYIFLGWYYNNILLSNQTTYKYSMWNDDVVLEARFKYNSYILTLESDQPDLGLVSIVGDAIYKANSSKTFDYLANVTISAYTSTDVYRFLGWFDNNGNLVETNAVYSFLMPHNNFTLHARWDAPSFSVSVKKQYDNGGTVTGVGLHSYNSYVSLNVCTNEGYIFNGWYKGSQLVSNDTEYSFRMPFENISFNVNWNLIQYSITYNLDGGQNSDLNVTNYNVESPTLTLYPASSKKGYSFDKWVDSNGQAVEKIPHNSFGNIVLIATWKINSYNVTLFNESETKGTIYGSGVFAYNSTITVSASPNTGYDFDGWYLDNSCVSTNKTYSFVLGDADIELHARWKNILYSITYYLRGGTNSLNNPTTYTIESEDIHLENAEKTGYIFLGWTLGSGDSIDIIPNGTYGNLSIYANWEGKSYTISLNPNGGDLDILSYEVISGNYFNFGKPEKRGYTFTGWTFNGETIVGASSSGYWNCDYGDIALLANWMPTEYTITYNLDGGINSQSNPSKYTIESNEIVLYHPIAYKTGYLDFAGWFDENGNKVEIIPRGSTGDIVLFAQYQTPAEYSISYVFNGSFLEDGETNPTGYCLNDAIILHNPKDEYGHEFEWYDNSNFSGTPISYIDGNICKDITLYAKKNHSLHFDENNKGYCDKCGLDLEITKIDDNHVAFGYYPQSYEGKEGNTPYLDSITETNERGYYEYNGDEYQKKKSNSSGYENLDVFEDGTVCKQNVTYYFKVKPIIWRILSNDNGKYFLFANQTLYSYNYGSKLYNVNGIRNSLNATSNQSSFINKAFSSTQQSLIKTTLVDNSEQSQYQAAYACSNVEDKIFLLSYSELFNESYFANQSDRAYKPSDYCIADGYCYAFLSRCMFKGNQSSSACNYGIRTYGDGCYTSGKEGVRPALVLSFK